MKVTTKGFKIIEGFRIRSGVEFTVDKKLKAPFDLVGKRMSKKMYDEHFAPVTKETPNVNKTTKED